MPNDTRRKMEPQPPAGYRPYTRLDHIWSLPGSSKANTVRIDKPADMPGAQPVFEGGIWWWEAKEDAD